MVRFAFCFPDWKQQLRQDLHRTQNSAFAQGTVSNFKSQWKKFATCTHLMGEQLLPISSSDLCLYIQFLMRSFKSPQSVNNYVHGLKFLHQFIVAASVSFVE
jgi:site-specific recombinase XerD